jgi:transcription termination factor Rho
MSVLDRTALEASPLADLHEVASELSIDGYRRLRRADLIDAILGRQGGDSVTADDEAEEATPEASVDEDGDERPAPPRRRGRKAGDSVTADDEAEEAAPEASEDEDQDERPSPRRRRGRRGGRGRGAAKDEEDEARSEEEDSAEEEVPGPAEAEAEEEPLVEGVVELLPNGSGFVRVDPPDPSDNDVYISAAQVKRCELVSGDRIAGPRRAPRRSERFASLVRIDTINGQPADEVTDSARFDDLPAAFPSERFKLGSEDPTIKAIEWLTPIGRGSRVTIVGPARAGKSEALRRLAGALAEQEDLQKFLVLAGVRPEEISDWASGPIAPVAAVSVGASGEVQGQTIERVIEQARRIAARGAHAIVLIDTLDGVAPGAARKLLAAARKIVDGGSLTVIATASQPLGGETTVIALDVKLTSAGRFPAVDLTASGTIKPELLVGDAGAEAIARVHAEALEPAE